MSTEPRAPFAAESGPVEPADLDLTADEASARSLARTWIALGAHGLTGRAFLTCALCFAAVLWGEVGHGAFFRTELIIFTVLCIAAALASGGAGVRRPAAPWLAWSAGAVVAAIAGSAIANQQYVDALYPLASVAAAVSLGWVGLSARDRYERMALMRSVVDVAVFASIVGWIGVAFHISRFAQLQAQGWRATANFGYANVAALFLLIGLICACSCAAASEAASDLLRCGTISVALISTQSRGVAISLAVAVLVLWFARSPATSVLVQATVWGLVAFVGLVPSVESRQPNPVLAIVGAIVAGVLFLGRRTLSTKARATLSVGLFVAASAAILAQLNNRVGDSGSDDGRVQIWSSALSNLKHTGVWGAGPAQIASFSSKSITQLFAHDDPLQFAEYYGVLGAAALVFLVLGVGRVIARARSRDNGTWPIALAVAAAVAVAALVDFPLQVPLIPATTALVIGLNVASTRPAATR